jgi:hypothetical protein
LLSSADAPDAAAVKAQGEAVAKGTAAAGSGANTINVTGLTASATYTAYIVVSDAAGNDSTVLTITGVNPVVGTGPDTDTRVTLAAGEAASPEATAATADVTFTGATGLDLSPADFVVDNDAIIYDVTVDSDTATVTVNFPVNDSTTDVKTYTVSIAESSTLIKGDAAVTITQAVVKVLSRADITVGFNYGGITIIGGDYINEISISGAEGKPTSLTLSATGYTNVIWYVDAGATGINGDSVTLEAEEYAVQQPHSITFTGTAGGHRYSSNPIPFTVLN